MSLYRTGSGRARYDIPEPSLVPPDYFDTTSVCPECMGDKKQVHTDEDGVTWKEDCPFCEGKGWILDE